MNQMSSTLKKWILEVRPYFIIDFVIRGKDLILLNCDFNTRTVLNKLFIILLGLGVLSYFTGDRILAINFTIPYIEESKELLVVCGILCSSVLSFLWFNV